jgi:uncharacterized protein (TIGR03435 family)
MAVRFFSAIALLVANGLTGLAQSVPAPPDPDAPAFEVTSVKRNITPDNPSSIASPPGRFVAVGMPIASVITHAYGLRPVQLVGAPKWAEMDEFDVVGKAPDTTPSRDIAAMLRRLLSDRFNLRAHVERRELPVFALVADRANASPRLTAAKTNCEAAQAAAVDPPDEAENPKTISAGSQQCREQLKAGFKGGRLLLTMVKPGTTMAGLARTLSGYVDRIVLDRTNMSGFFDVSLEFDVNKKIVDDTGGGDALPVESGPSLFTALQEQLGLRLRPERGQVEVLVIDRIELPTPD